MSRPVEAGTSCPDSDGFEQNANESMSRLRANPLVSDVLALSECEGQPAIMPPPLRMPRAFDELGIGDAALDPELMTALRAGDASRAIRWLLRDNTRLHQELESAHEDFESLRGMNVQIQQQLTVVLGTTDDARLELASALEQAKDRVLELERNCARLEGELEQAQSDVTNLCTQLEQGSSIDELPVREQIGV